MLTLLRISGFALIDEIELGLEPGLTVITGETGAGKSIIVDALGLLRGGRAGADVIRTGRDEARVEAAIDLPDDHPVRGRLTAAGREADGELLVRRTVSRTGRGRIHLGGALATAGDLAETVGDLVDIASQHDQQTLTDPERQLAILDAFAGNEALRAAMAEAYEEGRRAADELERFDADARTRVEREDLLRFQLSELGAARVTDPNEDVQLKSERERLRGAERFRAAAAHGEDALYAGEGAASGRIGGVVRELGALAHLDTALAPFVDRLREAQALVDDVARELGRYGEAIEADEGRLGEVDERLFLLSRLARKHGGTLADVIAREAAMQRELAEVESFDDALAARRQAVTAAEAATARAAEALSRARASAATALGERVDRGLAELGLPAAKLPVVLEPRDAPGPAGAERVRFLFAPNPGEPPRPLAKIASGGELSRVMLAMKQALMKSDRVATTVFDEIDAGIGGAAAEIVGRKLKAIAWARTAEIVGRKLKAIASGRQVIAITHLPQIAVFADTHLRVQKTIAGDRAVVAIERLDDKERAAEIARMLSGASPSKQAMAHAGEMLRRAKAERPRAEAE